VITLNQKAILIDIKCQVGCIAIIVCCFFVSLLLVNIISISNPSGANLLTFQGIVLSERLSIGHQFIPINSGF